MCRLSHHCKAQNGPLENVAIANVLQLEAAWARSPALSPLITTPCQAWSRWAYPLPYYSVLLYLFLMYYFTLWPLIFNLEHLQHIACDVLKLSTIFECNRAIRGGVFLWFQCSTWPWTLRYLLRSALDNFYQVWPSTTYPCLNYIVFMLISYVTLWHNVDA